MSVNESTLAQAVIRALNAHGDWMGFEPLCQAILPEIGRKRVTNTLRDDIEGVLESEEVQDAILVRPSEDEDFEDEYIDRRHFFEGARFLMNFTPFEQEQKVLVPGHRFIPFIPPGWPGKTVLRYKGNPLKTKIIKVPFEDSAIYHSLLGWMEWGMVLSEDNSPEKIEESSTNNGLVDLTVFDLTPVFEDVSKPQQLLLECSDYDGAEIDIMEVKGGNQVKDFQGVNDAVAALDRAFMEVFEEYGPDALILPEQIAYAYARLPAWFFENPPFHFGAYLQLSDKVNMAECFMDTILWFSGRNPEGDTDIDSNEVYHAVERIAEEQGISPEELLQKVFENGIENVDELFGNMSGDQPTPAVQRALEDASQSNLNFDDKVYRMKVALDADKRVYRIIDVHSRNFWQELHAQIFDAFDRFDPHLFSFFFPDKPTKSERTRMEAPEIGCPEEGGGHDDAEYVMIGEVSLEKGTTFYYLFDWGDCWWHEIKVQSITDSEAENSENYPAIVKSVGESPEQY